jgi:hypothetical protein
LPSQETIDDLSGRRYDAEFRQVTGRVEDHELERSPLHYAQAPRHHRKPCIYIIGSLRNKSIPTVGNAVRAAGFEAFDDWHGTGPEADDHWFAYEKLRGRSYAEALAGRAAQNTFALDRDNILRSEAVIMVMPTGKSGHMEFGFARGKNKPGVILLDGEPDRYDVMYNFASLVTTNLGEAIDFISKSLRVTQ